jgi:hypothetical protein
MFLVFRQSPLSYGFGIQGLIADGIGLYLFYFSVVVIEPSDALWIF